MWQGKHTCDDRSFICGIRTKFRFGKNVFVGMGVSGELWEFAGINDIKVECCLAPPEG